MFGQYNLPLRQFSTSKFIKKNWRFFSLSNKAKGLCFSIKKSAVKVVFKCEFYLINSIKLIKKIHFTVWLKIFLATRVSGNKSIFLT